VGGRRREHQKQGLAGLAFAPEQAGGEEGNHDKEQLLLDIVHDDVETRQLLQQRGAGLGSTDDGNNPTPWLCRNSEKPTTANRDDSAGNQRQDTAAGRKHEVGQHRQRDREPLVADQLATGTIDSQNGQASRSRISDSATMITSVTCSEFSMPLLSTRP